MKRLSIEIEGESASECLGALSNLIDKDVFREDIASSLDVAGEARGKAWTAVIPVPSFADLNKVPPVTNGHPVSWKAMIEDAA